MVGPIVKTTKRAKSGDGIAHETVQQYAKPAPRLASWLETNLLKGWTVIAFPAAQRRLLRTTNGLERVNQEIRRRTRGVGIFPNEASCLRLVRAIAMEISEEWEAGKAYLSFLET